MTECDECGSDNEPGSFNINGKTLCRSCRNSEVGDTKLPGRTAPSPQDEQYSRSRVINNDRGQR